MADDILQEVPEIEIPKVLEAMKRDWPNHFLFYQYVSVMEDYKKDNIQVQQVLYRYGDIDDGVYLLRTTFPIIEGISKYFFLYTASADLTDLSKVLMETSRIQWTIADYVIEATMIRFTPAVKAAGAAHGVMDPRMKKNYMYWLPPEEKLEFKELPEDVYLDFLDDSHVPEVDKNWPHSFPGSEGYLGDQIRNNFALGLFRKSDKKMLSSALSFHSGGIYVLYSDPEFRGKGYAEIVVRNMAIEIRRRGRIAFGTILLDNIPSIRLFKKLGFTLFDRIDFIFN